MVTMTYSYDWWLRPLSRFLMFRPTTEGLYWFETAKALRPFDKKMAVFYTSVHFIVMILTSHNPDAKANCIVLIACLAFAGASWRMEQTQYQKWRVLIIFCCRSMLLLGMLVGLPHYSEDKAHLGLGAHAVFGTGVFTLNYVALGTVLPFFLHLPFQVASTILFARVLNHDLCEHRICTVENEPATHRLYGTLSIPMGILSGHTAPQSFFSVDTDNCWTKCATLTLGLQLLLGVVLPSSLVYLLEYSSKRSYLVRNQQVWPEHYDEWIKRHSPLWEQPAALLCTLLFFAGASWEVAYVHVHTAS